MNGKLYGVALGLGYLCLSAGIVMIGITLTAGAKLLVPGLAVVVIGLAAIGAANAMRPK